VKGSSCLLKSPRICVPAAMLSEYNSRGSADSSTQESEIFDIDDRAAAALYRPLFLSPRRSRWTRYICRRVRRVVCVVLLLLVALIAVTFLFFPSYTHYPLHYRSLEHAIKRSQEAGRGNPRNEKVFIANNLYDASGELVRGKWGSSLLELIDLLGEKNTFLSIYENDAGDEAWRALTELDAQVKCNKSIVFEPHYDFSLAENVTLPDGSVRLRRVPYLADLRNRALRPLEEQNRKGIEYDKILFLNDVYYNPVDIMHLLFSTNADQNGVSSYRAACAVDFGNLIKFYDSFAVRDAQGYPIGVPFYPWFVSTGAAISRKDVLAQKDAVRVRSCWGGIVAFDAKYFQANTTTQEDSKSGPHETLADRREEKETPAVATSTPARFRSIPDVFWEASESCLIHADLQDPYTNIDQVIDTGIYINPYIRVSYEYQAFTRLGFVRRFERLFTWPNWIANVFSHHPAHNSRRTDIAGETVEQRVWQLDASYDEGGYWKDETRVASRGGFCAQRGLFVLNNKRQEDGSGWEPIRVPPDPDSLDWTL
jgi:hypothetical protein